ncbi:NAD(P)/FAD-dependent oxidoreductase [Phenylobacterium sp.]|uniref:FAD-dependent oxidoreductase n=1 Tax=Phenylobacterium sp. TaxID=1871053 RepID=UPI0027337B18|nr:FAD-dependent monooxygenase [Phenylobacterium sp.]MDP3634194.1 FAD-dependent monooxygenase [Phenylobacterium sp.]
MGYDLIVVGGGVGGSALSAVMAQAGAKVLLLEAAEVYQDKVRGEWIAPWGVTEVKRLGLYDLLVSAGGHHIETHISYDENRDPEVARSTPAPLGVFAPGVPGPLCLGHPQHCQTLFDEAVRRGVDARRGVQVISVTAGASPTVTFRHDGEESTATARLLVGADGRTSMVRESLGIPLHQDAPHHMFAGLLVDGAPDWDAKVQAIGVEGDFSFLAFPQGSGRVRLYGSYALDQRRRFAGPDGPAAFLEAFRMECSPDNVHLAGARPIGPLLSYFNNDAWTDQPFAPGAVLVGDAGGWNDPIIGLGLSITYRDVRIVTDILKADADWAGRISRPTPRSAPSACAA